MLEKELETAITLAKKAGKVILGFYNNGFDIEEKIPGNNVSSPVTIADRMSSKVIVEGVAKIFANDGILSEEETDDKTRLQKQRVWIIDPLDGTKGFINKNGDFAVQIGLAENNEAVLGVVFLPLHNTLYYAAKDEGAWGVENEFQPKQMHVSKKTNFGEITMVSSLNHRSPQMSKLSETFGFEKEIQRDSVGVKVGLITRRICDLYIHISSYTKHWDTCAPEIILREAGGEMTDLFGQRITYNTNNVRNFNGILASNGVTHSSALANLKNILSANSRI